VRAGAAAVRKGPAGSPVMRAGQRPSVSAFRAGPRGRGQQIARRRFAAVPVDQLVDLDRERGAILRVQQLAVLGPQRMTGLQRHPHVVQRQRRARRPRGSRRRRMKNPLQAQTERANAEAVRRHAQSRGNIEVTPKCERRGADVCIAFSRPGPDVIRPAWAATGEVHGLAFVPDLADDSIARIARAVQAYRRPGDIVLVSVHWGGN
jgi:hypothetical protein